MRTGSWRKTKFNKADFRESAGQLPNPGRGWYHVYSFEAKECPGRFTDGEESPPFLWEEETLALVLIDIGAFRSCEIPKGALSCIGGILEYFRKSGKDIILRFAYDRDGHGMEREPSTAFLVKRHMEQLGEIIYRYSGCILVVQGLFIGSWGEMHGSKFLTDGYLAELADTLYREIRGSCCLAVRTPAQWRRIAGHRGIDTSLPKGLALFNDGMFGSPTDLGTYGGVSGRERGERESWSREEELDWQDAVLENVPNGGEALAGEGLTGYEQAAAEMKRMHVSYLNSSYEERQLNRWKAETVKGKGCWKGASGYEYIGGHLGYRFVVRDVKPARRGRLRIIVENRGFAGMYEAADCFLTAERGAGTERRMRLDTDVGGWRSGRQTVLEAELPEEWEAADGCRLWLEVRRRKDGRAIYFANEAAGEKVPLGRLGR